MVGWHHRLNGHESEPTPGDGEGQGSLACHSPWVTKSRTGLSNSTTATYLVLLQIRWFSLLSLNSRSLLGVRTHRVYS